MKSFWSKYKIGLLLLVLPGIVIYLLYSLIGVVWSLAAWVNGFTFGGLLGQGFWFILCLSAPFFAGWLFSGHSLGNFFLRIFSFIPIVNKFFKFIGRGDYLDKIKRGDYKVAFFKAASDNNNPSYKLGLAVNNFIATGADGEDVEMVLIIEGTPPIPAGPRWIKRKSDVIFLKNYGINDELANCLSLGLNLSLEEKPKLPA